MWHLNFTWNVTEYTKDFMKLKLNFTDPYSISPMEQQDQLVFHIKDKQEFFISETLLVDIHDNFTTLKSKIPKQMPDNMLTQSLTGGSAAMKDVMQGSFLISVAMNIVIAGSLSHIMGMIKSLQLVFHLPIMTTIAPANVMTMWQIIIPIVMFDILESIPLVSQYFPDSEQEMSDN